MKHENPFPSISPFSFIMHENPFPSPLPRHCQLPSCRSSYLFQLYSLGLVNCLIIIAYCAAARLYQQQPFEFWERKSQNCLWWQRVVIAKARWIYSPFRVSFSLRYFFISNYFFPNKPTVCFHKVKCDSWRSDIRK